MFRLEYLKLRGHRQLGDLELNLIEDNEEDKITYPYTTVVIGLNGTGKSFLLRTIVEIFRQFKEYSETEKKEFNLPFGVHIRYKIANDIYEIISGKFEEYGPKGVKKYYYFYKNRPFKDSDETEKDKFKVPVQEIAFPHKIIANAVIPTDRFVFQNSNPSDFYQYQGVRSTSSTTSTRTSSRRTVKHLFNATQSNSGFRDSLMELLRFLDFEENFKVHYQTKINKLFFSPDLTVENFRKYYEEWWAPDFTYTSRKKEHPLYCIPYYNNTFKENSALIEKTVAFLKHISGDDKWILHKDRSKSKILSVDLFADYVTVEDLEMISYLENLDIINIDGIKIQKNGSTLSINDVSSGEYHLLVSLISIFSSIDQNSLVLIDEPEISLHPSWQMRYVTFLKQVFLNFSSCHFILTSHSHFIVSDLEGNSSAVLALKRNSETGELHADLLQGTNTFGWSAEEVLLDVFQVPTTRNQFIYEKIGEILELVAQPVKEKAQIRTKLLYLQTKNIENLSPEDPLKKIIDKLFEKYVYS